MTEVKMVGWHHRLNGLEFEPWTAAFQAPPSMGFSRQEYWSGVPLPSPIYGLDNPKEGRQPKN